MARKLNRCMRCRGLITTKRCHLCYVQGHHRTTLVPYEPRKVKASEIGGIRVVSASRLQNAVFEYLRAS